MAKRRNDGRATGRESRLARWTLLTTALLVLVVKGDEKPLQKLELLLLASPRPSIITVGLHIEIASGWHVYWINPGDAGLAPEVTWDLPPGYEAGPLQYPVPEKIVSGNIVTYGFKDEVLIVCRIQPAGAQVPTRPPTIACRLNWMACQESCVTGQEDIKVSPAAQTPAGLEKSGEILARFAPRFPLKPDPTLVLTKEARLVKQGNGWQAEIPLSGKDAARVSDFYPYPIEDFVIAHSRIARNGEIMIIPLDPSGPSAVLTRIDGLLILGDEAYEISIPIGPIDHLL